MLLENPSGFDLELALNLELSAWTRSIIFGGRFDVGNALMDPNKKLRAFYRWSHQNTFYALNKDLPSIRQQLNEPFQDSMGSSNQ